MHITCNLNYLFVCVLWYSVYHLQICGIDILLNDKFTEVWQLAK